MESNYEKQVYIARSLFLDYDQNEMIRKFSLKHDEQYLYIELLDAQYRISRAGGEIEYCRNRGENRDVKEYRICLDYQVVMTICDVLCHSDRLPVLAHEWCPLHALQVTMSSPGADTFTRSYAKLFSGNTDRLLQACRYLGGQKPEITAGADVCWQFDLFPFFPVQLRFWDGDEEFEPKIQLLWDRNTLDFMHFETVYYVLGHLLERLAACMEEGE